ncbi:MAG: DUF3429 domain-containing protein [Pseudomonadota bacterium]
MPEMTDRSPALPKYLTYAGMLPFLLLAAAHLYIARQGLWSLADLVPRALLLYAITIFSFLNGIRWGMAIVAAPPRSADIAMSILAFFAGWGAFLGSYIFVLENRAAWFFLTFAALFLLHYLWDRSAANEGNMPIWFVRQRLVATIGAAASLATSAIVIIATT